TPMPALRRRAASPWLVLLLSPPALHAQASAYIPLDDPRLPLIEHLIARGEISDPTPMMRPFRRSDAVRVLEAADSGPGITESSRKLIGYLLTGFGDPKAETHWSLEGRAGGQAFSHARRDPLHPAGRGEGRPYAEVNFQAVLGNLVLVSRPALEPRLVLDPDWPGRKDIEVSGRQTEGYLSGQFRWVSLYYGQMDRNWGPVGAPGIGLSAYAYPRPSVGLEAWVGGFRLSALAAELRDETDSLGRTVHRYAFAHRLSTRLSPRLSLAIWETTVLAGVDRNFDGRYRNPVTLLVLGNQYGLGDEGNVLFGLDAQWRPYRRVTIQLQLALDDFQYKDRGGPNRYPDRYAFSLAAFGPLAGSTGWRALYTQASSLAFRATDQFENLTDAGVGLGRNFDDNDQLSVFVSVPARLGWLLTPELTVLRQGEGRLSDPVPPTGTPQAGATPQLFIGTVERTYRAALDLTGRRGPLSVSANAGFHHVVNRNHQPGRTADRFEGRITATLGFGKRGVFH
ncbi:MAG: hypothetical protein ACREMO_06545, partial [Gemmatimonadales bacterium]